MRKGFIIDLQSGLNWDGEYAFADESGNVGPPGDSDNRYLFPNSSSFQYTRKTRIGDMWKVSGSSHTGRLRLLLDLEEYITISEDDYLIAKATGSDGYVCRFSSSHWDIHKTNPGAGDGLNIDDATNLYSVNTIGIGGLVANENGIGITGSNFAEVTDIENDDSLVFITGSDGTPRLITYDAFKTDIVADTTTYFADGYLTLDYKFTSAAVNYYNTHANVITLVWSFGDSVTLAPNADFSAHIGNLFLKVSGTHNALDAEDYEIENVYVDDTTLGFKVQNLKFTPEIDDIAQVFCFISGSISPTDNGDYDS